MHKIQKSGAFRRVKCSVPLLRMALNSTWNGHIPETAEESFRGDPKHWVRCCTPVFPLTALSAPAQVCGMNIFGVKSKDSAQSFRSVSCLL